MKAATRHQYGSPDVIRVTELEKPVITDDDILVKVHAATVNRTDCGILTGTPFVIKFFTGFPKPKDTITGTDFAGEVIAVGKNVKASKAGDKIMGFDDNGLRSHAEFLCINKGKAIIPVPGNMSFAEAAASAEGAHYAYNFINKVDLKEGQHVLVNGATGAIGSAALQMLKYKDLQITATANTKNLELIRSMGADKVIDYTKEDFTKTSEKFDFVFDAVGKSSFGKCKPLLKPHGVYISSELGPGGENIYLPLLTGISRGRKVKFPVPTNIKRSLKFVQKLIEAGKFKPVIDRHYSLDEIAKAYEYVDSGQKTGNVVIDL